MKGFDKVLTDINPGWCHVYPNAGLPNAMGGYDEDPEFVSTNILDFAKDELLNFVGGCCGTFPSYIAEEYYLGDADICETNTFNGTSLSQAEYKHVAIVYQLNKSGAALCRTAQMKGFYKRLTDINLGWCLVYPNAGLPKAMGGYDEVPGFFSTDILDFAKGELLHFVGGCCGTFPSHIAAVAKKAKGCPPRIPG